MSFQRYYEFSCNLCPNMDRAEHGFPPGYHWFYGPHEVSHACPACAQRLLACGAAKRDKKQHVHLILNCKPTALRHYMLPQIELKVGSRFRPLVTHGEPQGVSEVVGLADDGATLICKRNGQEEPRVTARVIQCIDRGEYELCA